MPSAGGGAERKPAMYDIIINLIRKSDLVVAATVTSADRVKVGDEDFVRAQAEVREVFKSPPQPPRTVIYDVMFSHRETPKTDVGNTYILILRNGGAGKEAGRLFLVDLARPIRVPQEKSEAYYQCIREYVAA